MYPPLADKQDEQEKQSLANKIVSGVEHCWEKLLRKDPYKIAKQCLAVFLPEENSFVINVLNEKYKASLPHKKINSLTNPEEKVSFDLTLAVLFYLTDFKSIKWSGELVSFKDLKGGDIFFTGAHAMEDNLLLERYGSSRELFLRAGESLGGEVTSYGDASFKLNFFPLVSIYYILWLSDEEFKGSISILFDKSIEELFLLDIIHVLIKITIKKLSTF